MVMVNILIVLTTVATALRMLRQNEFSIESKRTNFCVEVNSEVCVLVMTSESIQFSILWSLGVDWLRPGSVRDPFGLRLGFVRGLFGVRSESFPGPLGIRAGSVRGRFGIRPASVRDSFGVRSESVRGPKLKMPMYY